MNVITKSVQLPDGRTITIETGKVAKQADGAAVLRMGNTVLLATVCAAKDAVPGTDFMPLQVDYREQYSAAGRFPGGFTKREGKASDEEILTSRLVDRALRPLFPSNYHAEVYVQVMLLSADGVDQPDALAGFAASAAMACSDIPFEYYISEVRVARINGEYVVNPTFQQMEEADMDIMVGATKDNIMMVEGEMKEVSEQDLIGALKVAAEAIKPMCELQYELAKEKGTDVKREYDHEINDEELREQIKTELYKPAYDINHQALEKHARQDAFDKVLADFLEKYDAAHTDLSEEDLEKVFTEAQEKLGGKIDFVLHSVAMSPNVRKHRTYDDLDYNFLNKTLDISAISFHKMLQVAKKLDAINEWGSVVALTYVASQRTFFGYNDMADAKSMLESIARSFGYIYGREKHVRINTISQSPTATTAGKGIKDIENMMDFADKMSPLGNAVAEDCANYCVMMFSDFTRKVTMQNLFHDGGFSSMGMSLRAMNQYAKDITPYEDENGKVIYG